MQMPNYHVRVGQGNSPLEECAHRNITRNETMVWCPDCGRKMLLQQQRKSVLKTRGGLTVNNPETLYRTEFETER